MGTPARHEAIDISLDRLVELHLLWETGDQNVDVAIYFRNLTGSNKVKLVGTPITQLDPLKTTYTFEEVAGNTPGSFLYYPDDLYGRRHEVEVILKPKNSQASTTAIEDD